MTDREFVKEIIRSDGYSLSKPKHRKRANSLWGSYGRKGYVKKAVQWLEENPPIGFCGELIDMSCTGRISQIRVETIDETRGVKQTEITIRMLGNPLFDLGDVVTIKEAGK